MLVLLHWQGLALSLHPSHQIGGPVSPKPITHHLLTTVTISRSDFFQFLKTSLLHNIANNQLDSRIKTLQGQTSSLQAEAGGGTNEPCALPSGQQIECGLVCVVNVQYMTSCIFSGLFQPPVSLTKISLFRKVLRFDL